MIPVEYCVTGQTFALSEKTGLLCLNPEPSMVTTDLNETSITFLLTGENLEILLTGDLEKEAEKAAAGRLSTEREARGKEEGQAVTRILKAGHHGSRHSSSEELLSAFPPDYALISAGRNNRYGHPHRETMERLREAGAACLSTQDGGAVFVRQHGSEVEVKTFFGTCVRERGLLY